MVYRFLFPRSQSNVILPNTIELHSASSRSNKISYFILAYLLGGATLLTIPVSAFFGSFFFSLFFIPLGVLGAIYLGIKSFPKSPIFGVSSISVGLKSSHKKRYRVFNIIFFVVVVLCIFIVISSILTQSLSIFQVFFIFHDSCMSFFSGIFLQLATKSTHYSIDLQTNELIIKYYSPILRNSMEQRLGSESIKSGILKHEDYGEDETLSLSLKTMKKEEIKISASGGMVENDLNTKSNVLAFSALSMMKYLKLTITLKGDRFPKERRHKKFTSEIFQETRNFLSTWQDVPSLEANLPKLRWKKVKDNPVVLQQRREIGWSYLILTSVYVPGLFFLLGLFIWSAAKSGAELLSIGLSFLLISPVIFVLFIVPATCLPLTVRKSVLKIDEYGVQTGFRYLGYSVQNIHWFYVFIRDLEIAREGILRHAYYVVADVFFSSVKLAKLKSKKDAEKFRRYISHLCQSYQKIT
ncbi:MAG: hypothetical protein ACFFBD_00570 [Candidatus Hodarchaeota archaeon]